MIRILKMILLSGISFGILMGTGFALFSGSRAGFYLGIGIGLLFGVMITAFAEWQRSQFKSAFPGEGNERLLKQGPANHFQGWEGVGGWLYLTDRRLLFRSHRFNARNHELSVPLDEIEDARTSLTARLIPNGLLIKSLHGEERFVVRGRLQWVTEIRRAKEHAF
jgi:hypothetical protein